MKCANLLFITAGVDDGSGKGNMKIKDKSYKNEKWTQLVGGMNIAEIQKQMREDGDDYVSNAMQIY